MPNEVEHLEITSIYHRCSISNEDVILYLPKINIDVSIYPDKTDSSIFNFCVRSYKYIVNKRRYRERVYTNKEYYQNISCKDIHYLSYALNLALLTKENEIFK